jgi:hypothetical protein
MVKLVSTTFALHIYGRSQFQERHMKSLVRFALAAVAGVTLAGCASYDYGSGYRYPYNGYYYGEDYGYGGDNDHWRGDRRGSHSAAPYPTGPNDPWGGTNKPNDRTSQQ